MNKKNVENGSVETYFFAENALLPNGWASAVRIKVVNGLITKITAQTKPRERDIVLKTLIPGMPNLHSHTFQRGMAGLSETKGLQTDSFWTWRQIMYRFLKHLGPDDIYAIAAMAFVEMLESGFTRVGEFHYLHHAANGSRYLNKAEISEQIVRAAVDVGINLTLLPVFYAHSDFGGKEAHDGQARFVNSLDEFATLYEHLQKLLYPIPGAVLGLAPHSLRAVTCDQLHTLLSLVKDETPVHIHIAEQQKEVDASLSWSGKRPVRWLLDNVAVDSRWCLVHATHMSADEIEDVVIRGAVAGLCPITEGNLGDGFFAFEQFIDAKGLYGIGTDSNILIDTCEELRLLEYGQRLFTQRRNIAARKPGDTTGLSLWQNAVAGGAQALGCINGLNVGAPADMVSLSTSQLPDVLAKPVNVMEQLVFCKNNGIMNGVWVNGQPIIVEGQHPKRLKVKLEFTKTINRILLQ